MKSNNIEQYRKVYSAFLEDGVITDKEREILEDLQRTLGLTTDEVKEVENVDGVLKYQKLCEEYYSDSTISSEDQNNLLIERKQLNISKSIANNIEQSVLVSRNKESFENISNEYFAFISYSHKDKKLANWLHKKIERYRLPKYLNKISKERLPERIKPVFLDKEDIGTGSLENVLRKELSRSKYLIVICSQASANSYWVKKEVETFVKLGKGNRIIPFINSNKPETEKSCFPSNLSTETLGASIKEIGRKKALVKVIATLVGVGFDQLWQRFKRRQNILNLSKSIGLFLFIMLIVGLILSRTNIRYQKELNKVERLYTEGNMYINEGDVNTGLAYLARSIKNIEYIPAKDKINKTLLNESFLILDTIENIAPPVSDILFNHEFPCMRSHSIKALIKNDKLNIFNLTDSSFIGTIDLYHKGKVQSYLDYSVHDSCLIIAEPIYTESELKKLTNQDKYSINNFTSELVNPNKFRIRAFDIKTLSMSMEFFREGTFGNCQISPMGSHAVITYIKKDVGNVIEAVSLKAGIKSWKSVLPFGVVNKILINPNGLNFSLVAAPNINQPETIFIFDLFNSKYKVKYNKIPTSYIQALSYSNDGRRLATLTKNGYLRIYDINSCEEIFVPTLISTDINTKSINFDITDTKLRVITNSKAFVYLLQKSPDKSNRITFKRANAEHMLMLSDQLIVTSHFDIYNNSSNYILFSNKKIPLIKCNEKILIMKLSKNNKYLIIGTGDRGKNIGNLIIYKVEEFYNILNGQTSSEHLKPFFKKQFNYPISLLAINDMENCIAVADTFGNKMSYINIEDSSITDVTELDNENNVTVLKFVPNSNLLAVGSNKINVFSLNNGQLSYVFPTSFFPNDIEFLQDERMIVSSYLGKTGEVNCFSKQGKSSWDSPLNTNFPIKKVEVVGDKVIVTSETNVILILNARNGSILSKIIIPEKKIVDTKIIDSKLKVLSLEEELTPVPYNERNPLKLRRKLSVVKTFSVETGKELTVPVYLKTKGKSLICLKNKTICFSQTEYFILPERLVSLNDLKKDKYNEIIECITNYKICNDMISTYVYRPLRLLNFDSSIKKWFSSNVNIRKVSPDDSTLIVEKSYNQLLYGEDEVMRIIEVHPSFLPAQTKYAFDYANKLAQDDIENTSAVNYLYGSYKATVFGDFYTSLLLKQHKYNIDALHARAKFCKQTNRMEEYNRVMAKITDNLLDNL